MKSINESVDSYMSITIDESQFYDEIYDIDDDMPIAEPVDLKEFKKECKKLFSKNAIRDYGAGIFELIITEADFSKFAILANEYGIEFNINDIVEF